jgi:uncharacterized protein
MYRIAAVARRYPLGAFFGLVFAVEWAISLALVGLSPMAVGAIALVPAPVALVVAGLIHGKGSARALLRLALLWRAPVRWYAVAIALPAAIHLMVAGLSPLFGATPAFRPDLLLAYLPVTFVLAAGEQIGWRGYAIPRLLERLSPLGAALVFGALHAAFHLPMYLLPLPDELRQAAPFALFVPMAMSFALFSVWIFCNTRGNVPLGIVYHAAINTTVIFLYGVEREVMGWMLPAAWIAAAVLFLALGGWRSMASRQVYRHQLEPALPWSPVSRPGAATRRS